MCQRTRALAGFVFSRGIALIVTIAPLAGCDSSTAVSEIPEQSRKAIIQRKVDVTPGTGQIIADRRRLPPRAAPPVADHDLIIKENIE